MSSKIDINYIRVEKEIPYPYIKIMRDDLRNIDLQTLSNMLNTLPQNKSEELVNILYETKGSLLCLGKTTKTNALQIAGIFSDAVCGMMEPDFEMADYEEIQDILGVTL